MAKNNEKQKEIDDIEMMINPRMTAMCEYEKRMNPEGCKDCDGQADPLNPIFCKINTITWRMSNIEKTLTAILQELQKR